MLYANLDPRIVRMPSFGDGEWLNTGNAITREQLRGFVVLIDFWDYTCVNCLRTLPYLTRWHRRYAKHGLKIIGVHSPEFKFAQYPSNLKTALAQYQIEYPILLDNSFETWSHYANKAWPTKYLVDADGYIRLKRQGEGFYREIERGIQALLRQQNPDVPLPELLPPLRAEDKPGAVCFRPTPELYAGYRGGGLFGGALGNPEGYQPQSPVFYELPEIELRQEGQFYVDGVWRAWPEALAFAGQEGGQIVLPYTAASVNGVFAPTADPVETVLNWRPTEAPPLITVRQDGRFLTPENAGKDVLIQDDGVSVIRIDHPRMFRLVNNRRYETHELTLTFLASGLALYAFSFTGCIAPPGAASDRTFRAN